MTAGPFFYRSEISVTLESPFVIQGLSARAFGIDAAQMRDHCGRPILPSTEIKGLIRHAATMIDKTRSDDLFGEEGEEDARSLRPIFSDCVARIEQRTGEGDLHRTTRVAIDDETGAVRHGYLQVVELVVPPGDTVVFAGNLVFVAKDQTEAADTVSFLRKAFDLVHAVGAFRTAGFGRVVSRSISEPKQGSPLMPERALPRGDFEIVFTLDRPLMVDIERVSDNVTRGASVIPGGVLKGVLAARTRRAGWLDNSANDPVGTALSRLTIGHAHPEIVRDDGKPEAVDPVFQLSLMAFGDGNGWLDAAVADDWEAALKRSSPAAFHHDWKESEGDYPPATSSERITRTRVAIDPGRGAGDEGKLFTQVAVSPIAKGKQVRWRARVSWPGRTSEDEDDLLGLLCAALADETGGLVGIGKTDASTVDLDCVDAPPLSVDPVTLGEEVRIMLITPHLMVRCVHMENETTLANAVAEYWEKVSCGALSLASDAGGPRIFAEQALVGGEVMTRFPLFNEHGADIMEPFVCMKPGSVFVLKIREPARAAAKLSDWLRLGLPESPLLPVQRWDTSPFVRENGYGAIRLNPDVPALPSAERASA